MATKTKTKSMLKNEAAYNEMNEQQKSEHIQLMLKKDLLTAIQCMSILYRNPAMLEIIATVVQSDLVKEKENQDELDK